MAFIRQIFIEL